MPAVNSGSDSGFQTEEPQAGANSHLASSNGVPVTICSSDTTDPFHAAQSASQPYEPTIRQISWPALSAGDRQDFQFRRVNLQKVAVLPCELTNAASSQDTPITGCRNKPAKKFPALHGQKNPRLPQGRHKFLCSAVNRHRGCRRTNLFIFRCAFQILHVNLFPGCILQALLLIFSLLLSSSHRSAHPCSHASTSASVICASAPGGNSGDHDVPFHGQIKFSTRYRPASSPGSPSSSFGRPIRT